jgi:hypothetical protein
VTGRALGIVMSTLLAVGPARGQEAADEEPAGDAPAQAPPSDDGEALAKKLSNPISSLISVPLQFNLDPNLGAEHGDRAYLNVQPVIPFDISEDWNLISRTIVPLIDQEDVFTGAGNQTGLGDITQSLFFSPKEPAAGGLIWGMGPVGQIPTATDDLLGSGKLSIGPTGVALTQRGPWTIGLLANHLWSVAGPDGRADVNGTFMQPFATYTTRDAWTFTLNTESTYNWETTDWSIPLNAIVSKVVQFGGQPLSVSAGARYWAEAPDGAQEGWGIRIGVTFLFPR